MPAATLSDIPLVQPQGPQVPQLPKGPSIGYVFAGIGTSADFEVGAISYLCSVFPQTEPMVNRPPPIMCGTSMGAINAAKLAEGTATCLAELQGFWLGLNQLGDLCLQQSWLQKSPGWIQDALLTVYSGYSMGAIPPPSQTIQDVETAVGVVGAVGKIAGGQAGAAVSTIAGLLSEVLSLFAPANTSATDLVNLYNNLISNSAIYDPTPMQQLLTKQLNTNNIASSGVKLRIGAVNLLTSYTLYFSESWEATEVVSENGQTAALGVTVSPIPAIMGCASFPGLFPPVNMESWALVDGSIRQSVPVAPAIAEGANPIYIILSYPQNPGAEAQADLGNGILGILSRATDGVMRDAIQESAIVPLPANCTLVQPSFSVHGTMAVDPGLISIAMAYGYIRAAEVANDATGLSSLSDQIILLRLVIWGQENTAMAYEQNYWSQYNQTNPPPAPATMSTLQPTDNAGTVSTIRNMKLTLRSLICQYTKSPLFKTGFLPATDFRSTTEIEQLQSSGAVTDYRAWYMQWERHSYPPPTGSPNPYSAFSDFKTTVPAVDAAVLTTMLTPCTTLPPFPVLNEPY